MLPKDLMLGAVSVAVTGQSDVYIENYRGIIEFTSECIRVQTKNCIVSVKGVSLDISYYTNDDMKITGQIKSIEYIN